MTSMQSNQGFIPMANILNSSEAQAKVNRYYTMAERARNCAVGGKFTRTVRNPLLLSMSTPSVCKTEH